MVSNYPNARDDPIYLTKWDGSQSHELLTIAGVLYDGKQLRFTARARDRGSFRKGGVGGDRAGLPMGATSRRSRHFVSLVILWPRTPSGALEWWFAFPKGT